MSEYKFVNYEKLDEHAHTDRMLSEEHKDAPEVITDKQLDSHRVKEKDTIMEDLLEKTRTGGAQVLLEKNLNDAKEEFGIKHRDSSTYEGDINKLEEKRLAKYNIEKEEYEVASETPKRQRWWEVKTKDGLKLAFKKASYYDDDNDGDYDRDFGSINWDARDEEFGDEFDDFSVDDLEDDTETEFNVDDLGDVGDEGDEGDFGDEAQDFLDIKSFRIVDLGGTPTAIGEIEIDKMNIYDGPQDPEFLRDLEGKINLEHPELPYSENMFDFSQFDKGIVTFRVGTVGSNSFEVDDITASSKNKVVTSVKKK